MLNDQTYHEWTSVFATGSRFEGSWEKGSKILFLDGEGAGMVSTIVENKPYKFISIKHLGEVRDGVEDRAVKRSGIGVTRWRTTPSGKRMVAPN